MEKCFVLVYFFAAFEFRVPASPALERLNRAGLNSRFIIIIRQRIFWGSSVTVWFYSTMIALILSRDRPQAQ